MSINRVTVTGNLTRDAELRTTNSGMAIATLRLAVNDRRKENGDWVDAPNYFSVTLFGKRAESLVRYLTKGTKVAVDGKLRWHEWVETGVAKPREKVEIVADDIELLSPKSSDGGMQKAIDDLEGEEIPF